MPKSFELLGKMIEQLQAEEWVGDSQVSALPATLEGRKFYGGRLSTSGLLFPCLKTTLSWKMLIWMLGRTLFVR